MLHTEDTTDNIQPPSEKTDTSPLWTRISELEGILDSINDGFFMLDCDLNFTFVNKGFEDICKISKEAFIGTNYWEQFPKSKSLKFYREYNRALKEQVTVHFEEYATSFDRWVSVSVYPSHKGLSVYFTDVTEQHEAQLMIETQNERLREIAMIVSHDLRGPVMTILGLASLLDRDQPASADNLKIFDGIVEACRELDAITKEIDEKTNIIEN